MTYLQKSWASNHDSSSRHSGLLRAHRRYDRMVWVVMKMPAGWQNWRDYFKKHKCPYTYPGEGEDLLEFMREMADALFQFPDTIFYVDGREINTREIKKKFREWK